MSLLRSVPLMRYLLREKSGMCRRGGFGPQMGSASCLGVCSAARGGVLVAVNRGLPMCVHRRVIV